MLNGGIVVGDVVGGEMVCGGVFLRTKFREKKIRGDKKKR